MGMSNGIRIAPKACSDMRRDRWKGDSMTRNTQSQITFKFKVYCYGEEVGMVPAINITACAMPQAGFQDA
ncbi:hypothetical protein CFR71_08070 [Novacetimonas pomaceti]|uniref:Uncharacterized protein n=1 Tax=Novacetimonas pomaceti TaxID=2021998 RepID=A0A318Q849_9PROT|nr:hypothetical protein CFR71_08070 [Novacetimonas pomaceti]